MRTKNVSKKQIIGMIVFAIIAIFVIGLSCYMQDNKSTKHVSASPTITSQKFEKLYKHKSISNLMVMPKNRKHINVSGNYKKNDKNYNFQLTINYKQL